MIYKMQLSDSVDTMIFELLEVPIEGKDITGIADNTTIDGNVFRDYLWLKKQWTQRWSIMCQDEYERLRGFWTRQFGNAEVPLYRLFYGENRYEDKNAFTVNGFVQIENDAPLYSPLSLTHLYGNAEQETLSGKNLLDLVSASSTSGGLTTTWTDNTGSTTGSTPSGSGQTASTIAQINTFNLPAGTYTLSTQSNVAQRLVIQLRDASTQSWNWQVASIAIGSKSTTFTIGYNADQCRIAYSPLNYGTTYNLTTDKLMLESGSTATSYEPYCGGVPMPNPQFPSPVNVVSGAQEVKIVGKNLWQFASTFTRGTSSPSWVMADQAVSIPVGTYTFSSTLSPSGITASLNYKYADNADHIVTTSSSGLLVLTFTEEVKKIALRINSENSTISNIMLESGSIATAYEPYQSQSYTIDLDTLELAKIGTYQDYIWNDGGTWKIHKEVGKVVLDGSESWTGVNSNSAFYTGVADAMTITASTAPSVLSDYYIASPYNNLFNARVDYGVGLHSVTSRVILRNKDCANGTALQTWLSTHNTTVYYALATPTDAEITDSELIEQLDHIYSLYGGVNNLWLIPSGGAQGEIGVKYRLNYEEETDIIPSTPVVLTLSDGGVINTCGCRQNIQLIMRETEND